MHRKSIDISEGKAGTVAGRRKYDLNTKRRGQALSTIRAAPISGFCSRALLPLPNLGKKEPPTKELVR